MIQKNSRYFSESLNVVKEFIQSITMVDDKAVFTNGDPVNMAGYFDAGAMIKNFAEHSIACSVFKFEEEEDIIRIANISQKSDITILDWKMELSNPIESEDENELEDDDKELKGHYTLEILKRVISSEYNKFKLFVIYTDEIDFNRIVTQIKGSLTEMNFICEDESHYSFFCNSNKITIFGKEAVKTKTTHIKEVTERSYSYDELPEALYAEFVNFTHGVVSNIFLKTITAIRANTYSLLGTFQRDIDAAFIAHKGLLPIPDDAHEHIVELIGSEIKSVIGGALRESITNLQIESFVESLDPKELLFNFDKTGLNNPELIPLGFTIEEFKDLLNKGVVHACNYNGDTKSKIELSKKVIKHLPQIIIKGHNPQIKKSIAESMAKQSHIKFARLTTVRNRYLDSNKPILTLGVILKGRTVSGIDEYWICIQPKCDSVRLADNENMWQGRSFIFLSLTKTSNKGEIVLSSNLSFKIEYNIIKSRQFMFRPTKKGMVVVRGNSSDDWFFLDSFGRRFEYIAELKNDFAQGIANTFASQVSRVATNHSEWLRLNASK